MINSIFDPFLTVTASAPGVINVTILNNIDVLGDAVSKTLLSTNAPLPASPESNPLGSVAVRVSPCVTTETFCMYGDFVTIPALSENLKP